jgi:hypothetical protein
MTNVERATEAVAKAFAIPLPPDSPADLPRAKFLIQADIALSLASIADALGRGPVNTGPR